MGSEGQQAGPRGGGIRHDRQASGKVEGVQPLRLKTLPVIFVAVQDLTLIVSGKTRQRCRDLGFEGMHFKWDRDRQKWYGPVSLKNLEALDGWPEA